MSTDTVTITQLYEQIPLEALQQVADSYMTWYVDRVTRELDETIAKLRAELEQNDKQEAIFKPSAPELDSMRRLQANKVTNVDLLDRLVEKSEEWLVLTMHRLDYFERAGLAPTDYPGWCEHALIGAYDWIDAARLHASKRMFSLQGGGTGPMRAIRPADLAAASASKKEAPAQPRSEAAPQPPQRPAPQPPRAEPPAPKPAAPRVQEPAQPATQLVPSMAQPAPAAQEQIIKTETAPLPPSAPRPEAPPRQAAPAAQAPQRPPAASGGIPDTPTRPTPVATATPKVQPPPQQPSMGGPGGQPSGNVGAPPSVQRRPEQPMQPPRPQQPVAPPPQAQQQQQQPYAAAPKSRPSSGGPNWGTQEPRPDPRYSLDDVEVDDLEEEGEDQGLIRKIFRVFTG